MNACSYYYLDAFAECVCFNIEFAFFYCLVRSSIRYKNNFKFYNNNCYFVHSFFFFCWFMCFCTIFFFFSFAPTFHMLDCIVYLRTLVHLHTYWVWHLPLHIFRFKNLLSTLKVIDILQCAGTVFVPDGVLVAVDLMKLKFQFDKMMHVEKN